MTITDTLIRISEWLDNGVCTRFKFKKEPEGKKPIDDNYEYEEVNPHAFPLFVPAKDKLPPNVTVNMPSICVQLMDGSDDTTDKLRDLNINLGVSCWNPGVHSKDIYYPEGTRPKEPDKFRTGYEGWMDVWNFVDAIIKEIESMTSIDGLYLAPDVSVRFGAYKEQETIVDFYPHWFAWIQFTLRSDFNRNNQDIERYL